MEPSSIVNTTAAKIKPVRVGRMYMRRLLSWTDLTGPAPFGVDQDLLPGQSIEVTVVFSIVHDIEISTTNVAWVYGAKDEKGNTAPEVRDEEEIVAVPTAATVLYFEVSEVTGKDVTLEWETAVEIDNVGFRLYRAPEPEPDQAEQVAYVPSEAEGLGALYEHTDTVPADGTWWYWLVGVDTSAYEWWLAGPVEAQVGILERLYLPLIVR